jgi:hypothetical protein
MNQTTRPRQRTMFLALLVITAGCGDAPDFRDQRLAEFAQQTMIEQRKQNDRIADQSEAVVRESSQLAETAKQLVEHDAQTRREMIAAQTELTSQLNQQQAVVYVGRDQLEQERQQIAAQRQRDPVIAAAIQNTGMAMACLLPLIVCLYVIRQMQTQEPDHAAVAELLIQEFSGDQPRLLPGPFWRPVALEHHDDPRLSDTSSAEESDHRGEAPF